MEITNLHVELLTRLRRTSMILSGAETEDVLLAMLQLYNAGHVVQMSNRTKGGAMEWHITPSGMAVINAVGR